MEIQRDKTASPRYSITYLLTLAAGDFVSEHEAERRVLQLINPALSYLESNSTNKQKHHTRQTHCTPAFN